MSGRRTTIRASLGFAAALLLGSTATGCGGGDQDPYAALDRARAADYNRIQVNLGFTVDVPAQADPNFPDVQAPATSINVDPSWITAAAEFSARRWYVRLALPLAALGMGNSGIPLGMPFDSIDAEALGDGTDVYVKSPLVATYLQNPFGSGGPKIEGDLSGWVRLGSMDALGAPVGSMLFGFPAAIPALPAMLPLPSPGDTAALKTLLTEVGATVEYAGTESVDGVDLLHLKGGLNVFTLVQSQPFLTMTGMTRDQVQSLLAMEGKIGIATELWVNKSSGRLATLRIEGTSLEPRATFVLVLRVSDPGADVTFEAPAAFTDVDLAELMGNQLPGFGVDGGAVVGGGGAVARPVPVPTPPATSDSEEQEAIDDILDDVGNELRSQNPDMP